MKDGKIITDLYVKPTDTYQTQTLYHAIHITAKKVSLTAKLSALIESVLIMPFLIRDVTKKNTGYMNGDIVKELLGKKY